MVRQVKKTDGSDRLPERGLIRGEGQIEHLLFVPDISYEGVDESLIPCDGYVSVVLALAHEQAMSTHAVTHIVRSMAQHPQHPARLAALIADMLHAQSHIRGALVTVSSRPGRLEHRDGRNPIHAARAGTLCRGRSAEAARLLMREHYPMDRMRRSSALTHGVLAFA